MTLIPVFVSGGIHLDGFMDTMDALGSWGDKEKKLEILKDSHNGAFAVIGICCYFTVSLGVWSEIRTEMLPVVAKRICNFKSAQWDCCSDISGKEEEAVL